MNNKEIKFKAVIQNRFSHKKHCEYYKTFDQLMWLDFYEVIAKDLQHIGLKDKIGKEIYERDLLRCKYKIGDNENWYVDAIYKVLEMNHEGLRLDFVKIFNDNKDPNCQIPISCSPSFKHGSLTTDFVNSKYDHLAFMNTMGENKTMRRTWKENHYSNDVEIIGNIYANPELLINN